MWLVRSVWVSFTWTSPTLLDEKSSWFCYELRPVGQEGRRERGGSLCPTVCYSLWDGHSCKEGGRGSLLRCLVWWEPVPAGLCWGGEQGWGLPGCEPWLCGHRPDPRRTGTAGLGAREEWGLFTVCRGRCGLALMSGGISVGIGVIWLSWVGSVCGCQVKESSCREWDGCAGGEGVYVRVCRQWLAQE